jgi:hypothetical protein
MPRLNFLLRLALAALLLAVWQGALLHPLQHVDAKGAYLHVPGKLLSKAPGDKGSPNPLCDAIAAVAACVSGVAPPAVSVVQGVETVSRNDLVALIGARSPAYRSQAPPALL